MTSNDTLLEADALLGRGKPKRALQLAKAAARQMPSSPHPANLAGMALGQMGQHREAAKFFQRAIKLAPDLADPRRNLAQSLILIGQHAQARKVLQGLISKEPHDGASWYLLAQSAFASGELPDAEEAIAKAIEIGPPLARNFNLRGLVRDKAGDALGALADFEAALKVDPRHVESLVNISLPLARQLRVAEARAAIDRAVDLAPGHIGARVRQAMHRVEAGETEAAIVGFEAILAIDPQNAQALEQLAVLTPKPQAHALSALEKRARRALKTVAKKSEDRASLLFALSRCAQKTDRPDEEMQALAQANREMATLMPHDTGADRAWEARILGRFGGSPA